MISKRALKCLRRVAENKSIPDMGALEELRVKKLIVEKCDPDDWQINITSIGKRILVQSQKAKS